MTRHYMCLLLSETRPIKVFVWTVKWLPFKNSAFLSGCWILQPLALKYWYLGNFHELIKKKYQLHWTQGFVFVLFCLFVVFLFVLFFVLFCFALFYFVVVVVVVVVFLLLFFSFLIRGKVSLQVVVILIVFWCWGTEFRSSKNATDRKNLIFDPYCLSDPTRSHRFFFLNLWDLVNASVVGGLENCMTALFVNGSDQQVQSLFFFFRVLTKI